jgi:hypothetical protein
MMPTDVATTLPQLDLRDQSIVTVTLDDPGAVITQLVLHCWQQLPGDTLPTVQPLLAVTRE